MKKKLIACFLIPAIFFSTQFIYSDDRNTKPKPSEEAIIKKFNYRGQKVMGEYHFPLTVKDFIDSLGKPEKTIVGDNETCPIGQLHIWSFKKVNFKVFVLGDEYASNIDYNASTRFFAVKKNDENKESKFGGFIGIGLGNTDKEVETKLEKFVKDNPIYTYSKEPGISPVHSFLLPFTSFKYQTDLPPFSRTQS